VELIEPIEITVPGEPVAQGRPRFTTQSGFARAYDPRRSRDYKNYVMHIASQICKGQVFTGAVEMTVNIYRQIPKSWTKKKQKQAEDGFVRPTLKPDVDNYVKGIKDALNGIAYVDDSQVVALFISKHYSREPRVYIRIEGDRYASRENQTRDL